MAPSKRTKKKPQSFWSQLVLSSWTKVVSIILTLGAVAGVFWAADKHWVNFPFHDQSISTTLLRSNDYAKLLDKDNEAKLKEFAAIIKTMQRDQRIQTMQNQVAFLMKQELIMKEGAAKLKASGKPINQNFQNRIDEVVKERENAESELRSLIQQN